MSQLIASKNLCFNLKNLNLLAGEMVVVAGWTLKSFGRGGWNCQSYSIIKPFKADAILRRNSWLHAYHRFL